MNNVAPYTLVMDFTWDWFLICSVGEIPRNAIADSTGKCIFRFISNCQIPLQIVCVSFCSLSNSKRYRLLLTFHLVNAVTASIEKDMKWLSPIFFLCLLVMCDPVLLFKALFDVYLLRWGVCEGFHFCCSFVLQDLRLMSEPGGWYLDKLHPQPPLSSHKWTC